MLRRCIGREFASNVLARVGDVSEDELLDTLDEAMASRAIAIVPGGPGRLRFAHGLVRDTLYERLTIARRVRLHRLVVEVLESLYREDPGPHLAELAHHSMLGSDYDRGLRHASMQAADALALLAYEEAARLYETALHALELSRPGDERARCELLLSLGDAETRAGNSDAAKRAFLAAAASRGVQGMPSELARAAAGYGGRTIWVRAGVDDRLVPLLEEALDGSRPRTSSSGPRCSARLAGRAPRRSLAGARDALSARRSSWPGEREP